MKKTVLLIVSVLSLSGRMSAQTPQDASPPVSIPDVATGSRDVTRLYVHGEKDNEYSWANWAGTGLQKEGEEVDIEGGGKAFLISNFVVYGSQFRKINARGQTLHIDVYPLQDMQLAIVPITNDNVHNLDMYGKTFENLSQGQWHQLELEMDDFKNLSLGDFYQIKYLKSANIDGSPAPENDNEATKAFYIGNVYLYDKAAGEGEAPVLNTVAVSGVTVVTATITAVATGNSDGLTFRVSAKDAAGNVFTATATGNSGQRVYIDLKGLDVNTSYTATVTVSDNARTSEPRELTFTTRQLPHAERPSASLYYYEDDIANLRGFLGEGTGLEAYRGEVSETGIGDGDNVLKFYGDNNVFGLNIRMDQEFGKDKNDNVVGIAVYPVDITEIQVAPRIYSELTGYTVRQVVPNQWNYITMKPLTGYEGGNKFIGIVLKGANGTPVFVDNFYMYTSDDVAPPTVSLDDIGSNDIHVNAVQISFSGADETSESVKYEIWVKPGNGNEYQTGVTVAANNENVTYYVKGLNAGTDYEIWIKARDGAENTASSAVKTFTTRSFTENISIASCEVYPDKGGLVVPNGVWDMDEFNKIAAEYPYGCFDVRNVQFLVDERLNRGADGIKLFNHNAYFITDINNKFDGNYVQPDEKGEFIGMNFQWHDGDFTITSGPDGFVPYTDIVNAYEQSHPGKSYPGLSSLGYIKLDPYTGYDLHFKTQGASITRQMFTGSAISPGDETYSLEGNTANKYSTILCPFALNTDKVANCEFYSLDRPSVNGRNVTLNFTRVTGKTEANKPYLIKVANDGVGGTAYFVDDAGDTDKWLMFSDIEYGQDNMIPAGETTSDGVTATLCGTYVTTAVGSDFYGLKQGNESLRLLSAVGSVLPAFRAAVKVTLPQEAKAITVTFDGVPTGVSAIGDEAVSAIFGNIYSIDGRVAGDIRNGLVNLPAGIYVVNGKKVVIK